jgi:hypothetical protein
LYRQGQTAEAEVLIDEVAHRGATQANLARDMRLLFVYRPGTPENEAIVEELWNDGELGTTTLGLFSMILAMHPLHIENRDFARPLADRILTQTRDAIAINYAAHAYKYLGDPEAAASAFDACLAVAENDWRTQGCAEYLRQVQKEKAKAVRFRRTR